MTALEALKACPLFKDFTDTGLQIFSGAAVLRQYPQGVPLFVENMVADSMLVLASGRVRLSTKNRSGEDTVLSEMQKGDHMGEMSLLQPGQRLCTATALEATLAFEIRHADFHKLVREKPQACLKLLMAIGSSFGQRVLENRDAFKLLLTRP